MSSPPAAGAELELRLLRDPDPAQVAALEAVLMDVPGFTRVCEGRLPGPEDVRELLADRPPDSTLEQKHVFGIFLGDELIGCVDALRGWPEADVCFIGLLLLREARQHQGLGIRSFQALVGQVSAWPEVRRLGLAVVETNQRAARFWKSLGFLETGLRRLDARYTGAVVRYEKSL